MVIRYLSSTYILVFIKSCLLQNRLYLSLVALLVLLISATDGRLPFRFRFRDSVPAKRSYVSLQCRGEYDPSRFAQLDGICEDCYNLYREPEVHSLCRYSLIRHQTRQSEDNSFTSLYKNRKDCFSSDTFKQCLQSLLLEKESQFYLDLVQIIGKKKKR